MNPGIYPGLPEAAYRREKEDRLSPSGTPVLIGRSPAVYRWQMDNPTPPTRAQIIGSMVHALALEGRVGYRVSPDVGRRKTADKELHAAFAAEAEAAGDVVITAAEAATVEAMDAALRAQPLVPALLAGAHKESSIFWTDRETGAACAGRPDALRLYGDGGATVLDLKTTLDASPGAFARAVLNYGYHVQAAAYLEGLRTLGYEARDFIVIAVEKSPPYCCAIYRMPDAAIELGAKRWREACALFAECTERGEWPGYPADLRELQLPAWALSEFYQSTEQET